MLFVELDDVPLSVMAYGWYVVIRCPLHYMVISNPGSVDCWSSSWTISILHSFLQTLIVLQLYYTNLGTPHYFCELNWMVHLPVLTSLSMTQ